MWLMGCITAFGQGGGGFNPTNPAEPDAPKLPHQLTVLADPVGGGRPSPTGKYTAGTTVSLRAYPATGYVFTKWTNEDGEVVSEESSFNITKKEAPETFTAHYIYQPSSPTEPNDPWLTLTIPLTVIASEGGYASGGGKYQPGKEVTVNASPSSSYVFSHWSSQEVERLSETASFTYTVRNERDTLVAHFKFVPTSPDEPDAPDPTPKHHVFTMATEGGTVSADQYIAEGKTVTVSSSANSGYVFLGWFKDGQLYNSNSSFSYTVGNADVSFEARFEFNPAAPQEPNFPSSAKKQVFYIENANGFQGEEMNLSVFLSSLNNIGDMTFQLSFPAQLTPSVEDGITYSTELNKYPTKTCTKPDDTTLKFTFSGGTLQAGNGALVTFRIKVPRELPTGTQYPVRMAQISFTEVGAETSTTANARNGHIGVYKHGDVNGDNNIDLADIHAMMLYIKGLVEPSDGFIREAADYTNDGIVDETDLEKLITISQGFNIDAETIASGNSLTIPTFETSPSVTHRYMEGFEIHLTNEVDVWGVQFDVLLPEGMTLDMEMPDQNPLERNALRTGEEADNFRQTATPLEDGWTRIQLYPTSVDRFITGFEGELLKVHYCTDSRLPLGTSTVGLRNVMLAMQRLDYDRPAYASTEIQVKDFIPGPYDAEMVIDASHFGTFVAPFDVPIPEGVKAYSLTHQDGTNAYAQKLNGTIPANTPVVVYSDEEVNYLFSGRLNSQEPVTVGILTGVFRETTAQATSFLLEVQEDGEPRLLLAAGTSTLISPSRAYIANLPVEGITQLDISWDEVPNGIASVIVDKEDQIFYDLQGRRCRPTRPGIYIQGGRKVIFR